MAQLASGVGSGGSGAVLLEFDAERARPGTYALVLLLEHPIAGRTLLSGWGPQGENTLSNRGSPEPVVDPALALFRQIAAAIRGCVSVSPAAAGSRFSTGNTRTGE